MGERHLVPAFGENAVCGEPARPGVAVTLFLKIATCPRCITLLRRLLPTVQVMDGETGEDFASDFEAHLYEKWYGEWSGEWCPAPTPRAP